jgi:DNA-3-methyladenine glycosylase I
MVTRCGWPANNPQMMDYHDKEWGVPIHDDNKLFEVLSLDGAQAGLSWSTILKRRDGYRKAFDDFNIVKISKYGDSKVQRLLKDQRIIRNQAKIKSAINNASRILEIKKEFRSFDNYIWGFVDSKPIMNRYKNISKIPANTELSDTVCADLKKRGFTFAGSTICYAFMQSIGMVNDHITACYRYKEIESLA